MDWLLCISVVFNILLLIVIALLVYVSMCIEIKYSNAQEQWAKWEQRFYEVQGKLLDEHNLFVGVTSGEYGNMSIKKR